MQKKKKRTAVVVILWLSFLLMVAVVMYLSFQNGAAAKMLGKDVIANIAERQKSEEWSTLKGEFGTLTGADAVAYLIRQGGRILAFFMIGMSGTIAVQVTFRKSNRFLKNGMILFVLVGIAYLTEKLKIYIPGRHYSYEEMVMSIIAVAAGFAVVLIISFFVRLLKKLLHEKQTLS